MRFAGIAAVALGLWAATCTAEKLPGHLETENLPPHLRDRGTGIPLSIFGTYVQKGQLLVYPFFEYYRDNNLEYQPDEFGFPQDVELRGKYRATEELLFLGYGFTDRFAIEMEAAIIQSELTRSSNDPSLLPPHNAPRKHEEDGLGDVEGQLRYRWTHEQGRRPEVFSYFETVFPTADDNSFIGTSDWEFKLGTGLVRGLSWGTVTVRAAVEYGLAEDKAELGECALEYLRRLSPVWRVFLGFEGNQDEIEALTEIQAHFARNAILKVNNGFGVTSKATDWAPEIGVMISLP